MTDPADTRRDDLLEAYLDGLLDDAQRAAFTERLRSDPELQRQVELQTRIDGALDRLFHIETPSHEQLAAALATAIRPPSALPTKQLASAESAPSLLRVERRTGARLYWAAAGLAAAAAIAWVISSLTASQPGANQPQFVARPLVDIYQDALARGFEPSYDCREPERFAATFAQRQGQPLRLLAMPANMKMLGIAYTGGLSRQTTAMLCRVDGQPVMTFVDRASADQPHLAKAGDSKLNVFRQERDGLVYYEVTPLDEPQAIPLFAPATAEGGPVDAPEPASAA